MNLYLLQYNNYYNRIVKREQTIEGYQESALGIYTGINFIPNDGITTTQIINFTPTDGIFPDYLVVANDLGEIDSRWFITESKNTRKGQYNLTLFRDVIADWYDEIVAAPCFVEKALVGRNDPAIFNNENMTFNQIKTKETLITDPTNSAWYAIYLSKELQETSISLPKKDVIISGTRSSQEDYVYDKYRRGTSTKFLTPADPTYFLTFHNRVGDSYAFGWDAERTPKILSGPNTEPNTTIAEGCCQYKTRNVGFSNVLFKSATEIAGGLAVAVSKTTNDWTAPLYSSGDYKTENELQNLLAENGKIYQFGNIYKQVVVKNAPEPQDRVEHIIYPSSPYAAKYAAVAADTPELDATSYNQYYAGYEITPMAYYVEYLDITVEDVAFNIPANKITCIDAPYDVMVMPYHSVKFGTIQSSPSLTSRLVSKIINTITDNRQLFDVQVLPYLPLTNNFMTDGEVKKTAFTQQEGITIYQEIGEAGEEQTFAIYLSQSSLTKQLYTAQIPVPTSATNFKVANECDLYRLVSPNYNGQFEFSATKNNGVSGYTLSIACKPISPYIKLAPIFNRLYGQDFGDARGLICGGDFSLFRIDDAWNTYELNNKNYLNAFDRQIESMEINNHYQMISDSVNAAVGTVQGTITGAMAGGMTPIPGGAVVGGIVGGVAAAAGGITDIVANRRLRQETLDFTKDQFGYQLGNIKAMPYSLSKVSSLTPDNKIFPVLEYYTCSDVEKNALISKIKYNGMTVMRIGTMEQFIQPGTTQYIKGKIIRLPETLAEDYHVAAVIADEINQGVFI